MKRSAFLSALLHAFIILLLMFNFSLTPEKSKPLPPLMVDIAKLATIRQAPKLAPEAGEKKITKPIDEIPIPTEESQTKPEPIKEEPKTEKEPIKKPEEIKKPEPPKKKEDVKKKPEEPKKPKKKEPEKKDKQEKPKKNDDKKLVDLEEKKKVKTTKAPDKKSKQTLDQILDEIKEEDKRDVDRVSDGAPAQAIGNELTMTEEDLIRAHYKKCWFVHKGMKNWREQKVEIHATFGLDGSVAKSEVVDKGRYASDSMFKAAAERALRAIRDPECQPLPLPLDKYDLWKDMIIEFDPKDM